MITALEIIIAISIGIVAGLIGIFFIQEVIEFIKKKRMANIINNRGIGSSSGTWNYTRATSTEDEWSTTTTDTGDITQEQLHRLYRDVQATESSNVAGKLEAFQKGITKLRRKKLSAKQLNKINIKNLNELKR